MNFGWVDIGLGVALLGVLVGVLVSTTGRAILREIVAHPLRRSKVERTGKGEVIINHV